MTHGYTKQNAQRTNKEHVSIRVGISHFLRINELSFPSTCQQGKCKHGVWQQMTTLQAECKQKCFCDKQIKEAVSNTQKYNKG